jgi:anti-anti-sigma factor
MSLTIDIAKSDSGVYRVALNGELDTITVADLETRMTELWKDPAARSLCLDLHDMSFISSMGLSALSKMKKAAESRGGAAIMVGVQPQIVRVFRTVKILPKQIIFTTREEADAYLATIQK